jgi:hypothetical protein
MDFRREGCLGARNSMELRRDGFLGEISWEGAFGKIWVFFSAAQRDGRVGCR